MDNPNTTEKLTSLQALNILHNVWEQYQQSMSKKDIPFDHKLATNMALCDLIEHVESHYDNKYPSLVAGDIPLDYKHAIHLARRRFNNAKKRLTNNSPTGHISEQEAADLMRRRLHIAKLLTEYIWIGASLDVQQTAPKVWDIV